jgi:hypothetical protein
MAHSGMSGSLADCSQDNVLSQRAGNTSAELPLDGNSLRSSETFTPQQVARQLDLTSSKTPSPTPRSKVMRSALRGRSGGSLRPAHTCFQCSTIRTHSALELVIQTNQELRPKDCYTLFKIQSQKRIILVPRSIVKFDLI